MGHISPYANELSKRGHNCTVAVKSTEANIQFSSTNTLYSVYSHLEITNGIEAFPNAKPANIIHAWTPRENVRVTTQHYQSRFPAAALIIHLEDNEDAIIESAYQRPIEQLRFPNSNDPEPQWNERLSHPVKYKQFLASADSITLLAPTLANLLPVDKESLLITPILDLHRFTNTKPSGEIKSIFSIPENKKLLVFTGGITSNNREDIRQLYLAVKLLQQNDIPVLIIKTGPSCTAFEKSFAFPLENICLDLGYIDESHIPELLSIADVLVQPGINNAFNRDRFPCKIPEFFASASPTIIPNLYDPKPNEPEYCCLLLQSSSPEEIASQIKRILTNPELAQKLGENAKVYAQKKYSSNDNTNQLEDFYQKTLDRDSSLNGTKYYHHENLKQRNEELAKHNQYLTQEIIELRKSKVNSAAINRIKKALTNIFNSKKPIGKSKKKTPPEGHPSYHKNYHKFIPLHTKRINEYIENYKNTPDREKVEPKISILLPVYNVDEKWLRKCIESVRNQISENWELCIADDHSSKPHIKQILDEYARKDKRIKVTYRETNGHISLASNSAFTLATGNYIALLDHDDELTPHALARVVETILANPDAKLIYSDEDKIDEEGLRHGPHFKSDWNYDLFLGCNMISHLGVYRRDAFEATGGFRQSYEGAQDWDLALRVIENCENSQIVHIPEILYHWRSIEGSTARNIEGKDYAYDAQRKAIADHLKRRNITAKLESVDGNHWRVIYDLAKPESAVSIIIPTKDRIDLLKPCIESILEKTTYQNYEIVIIDNASTNEEAITYLAEISANSKIKVLKDSSPFNYSALNNKAIAQSNSPIICLLNNDTEVISEDWLTEMVRHASRPEIGVVGAKLLFPHQHVQHGGVIMGLGGVAAHAFKFLHKDDDGHLSRAKLVSQFSAVTGACMVFKKSLWQTLKGLNEKNLPISYNDIDFCLRANQTGLNNLVTPFVLLYHKESESRGDSQSLDQIEQFKKESEYMHTNWSEVISNDPFYNQNLSLNVEDFSYRIS